MCNTVDFFFKDKRGLYLLFIFQMTTSLRILVVAFCICVCVSDAQRTSMMGQGQMEDTQMIEPRNILGRCNDRCYNIHDYCNEMCTKRVR